MKLLALPKYLLGWLIHFVVPRRASRWVFGSGAGVGEGALPLALELLREEPEAEVYWLVGGEKQAEEAASHGFTPVPRESFRGFWLTLTAGFIVVTHGLGDANRFGVFGGRIIQLWHGAPLKKLHFDSPVTLCSPGPPVVRQLLARMYNYGAKHTALYVAGSPTAAARLRSAFRVLPGQVRVLGDPRCDLLAQRVATPAGAEEARGHISGLLPGLPHDAKLLLYAPTWRDGAPDPEAPSGETLRQLEQHLADENAVLLVRSHPLGEGAYEPLEGERLRLLPASLAPDITPLLAAIDTVITDYSSIALDFALTGRPIVWFAPDLASYERERGLYEPLLVTARGSVQGSWEHVLQQLRELTQPHQREASCYATRELARRFHAHVDGASAARVLAAARRLALPARQLVDEDGVLFESFYGRLATCNPLALDAEIARQLPGVTRYWSVESEHVEVPQGAVPLLIGSREWHAARRYLRLLIVNDWLRFGFRRRRGQVVLQTWHGTMLKRLALSRPGVSPRTALAVLRESRRWSLLLSQNEHSTRWFRRSYGYRGRVLEVGYPRDDRLARAVVPAQQVLGGSGGHIRGTEADGSAHSGQTEVKAVADIARDTARRVLGVSPQSRVLVYAPTWRDSGSELVDLVDVRQLAADLGEEWWVLVRGHSRTHDFGSYQPGERVLDVSRHGDINDVLLAADLVVTDYSSIMFDASVARLPLAFFVPDIESYRERERGFTLDFGAEAPGPLLKTREELVACAKALEESVGAAPWQEAVRERYDEWVACYNPHDDGGASARVVAELQRLGALPAA